MAHLDTLPENFDLLTSKAMPPGHIKWPDLKLRFSKFESLSKTHQRSKLFETRSVQYAHRYLRFVYLWFLYWWLQVKSISWPPNYGMVKNEIGETGARSVTFSKIGVGGQLDTLLTFGNCNWYSPGLLRKNNSFILSIGWSVVSQVSHKPTICSL